MRKKKNFFFLELQFENERKYSYLKIFCKNMGIEKKKIPPGYFLEK